MNLFREFSSLLKPYGVMWGGDWERLVDGPHFQLPMTALDARRGEIPTLTLPPPEESGWALVVTEAGKQPIVLWLDEGEHIVTRTAPDRKRVYVDIRRD